MKIILDLGLQKTGSKARQRFFQSELHRIAGLRVRYCHSGRVHGWHRPLYESLLQADRRLVDELTQELDAQQDQIDIAILSYEELYKLGEQAIVCLIEQLPEVTAVIFLRRQDQLVNSFHNQLHKSHRVPLRDLETFESGMLEYNPDYDHRATLQRWGTILGADALRPVLFEKAQSSVCAFFQAADLKFDLDGYTEHFPNRAMDGFGLGVLRWVKRLAQEDELLAAMTEAHQVLARHFLPATPDQEHYSLSVADRERILSHYEDSNEWVRTAFFPNRPRLFPSLEPGIKVECDYSKGRQVAEAIIAKARESQT